jgi:transaldolase/glucose-6-phosphate isomerase
VTKLHQLAELGQAIWLDYIRRSFVSAGDLDELVRDGLRGVTSNPSIFEKAIAGSNDYDEDLRALSDEYRPVEEIYEALAIKDIQMAADVLRPAYDQTEGADGYVSLEVSPNLAYDTEGTVAEARRLWATLDRPNVMIKVPATAEGIPAIKTLIGEGINVNVTLMFSLEQYDAVAEAYLSGLELLEARDGDLGEVASVASFFVSRVDVKVDRMLDEIGSRKATGLKGKIGIANAKMANQRFRGTFSGDRWQRLLGKGARLQRVLWASTSTKDPTYPDTLYADNLIGPDTVNTLPPATLRAFRDHGTVSRTLDAKVDEAAAQIGQLAELGVDLGRVTDELLEEGVEKFARPFASLMNSIEEKIARLQAEWRRMESRLGPHQEAVDLALEEMARDAIIDRIWKHDHTVWKADPEEITDRLGWLNIAEVMQENVPRIEKLVDDVRADGYTDVLLLGMGGSSLAPKVFSKVFEGADGLDLAVLDSTDPDAVLAHAEQVDLAGTLFIVASKSGGTAETLSFFKFFYNRTMEEVGRSAVGQHFVAITDPSSKLAALGERLHFRAVFLNDPYIGGRYSALSYFGLVPAGLVGVDVARLLDGALTMAAGCESCVVAGENLGGRLGAILGELAKAGRDKVTFVTSEKIASFGDWMEQLIAESTGKSGTGILPVVGEPLGRPEVYGEDRLFVHLRLGTDPAYDMALDELAAAGHPMVRLNLHDVYDLGEQILLWEMATAVAGYRLGIHPFNQPNVEAAKVLARTMIAAYQEKGELPEIDSTQVSPEALHAFLDQPHAGAPSPHSDRGYIALQAYARPTRETTAALQGLRARLRDRYRLAVTVGYGPRFLHSTGQLHKGDAGKGHFVRFVSDSAQDAAIPDEPGEQDSSISFGVLKMAQALGDRQALEDAGRRVITFQLGGEIVEELERLSRSMD